MYVPYLFSLFSRYCHKIILLHSLQNEAWLCMEEMGTCLEKLYTRILPKLIPECIIGQVALSVC